MAEAFTEGKTDAVASGVTEALTDIVVFADAVSVTDPDGVSVALALDGANDCEAELVGDARGDAEATAVPVLSGVGVSVAEKDPDAYSDDVREMVGVALALMEMEPVTLMV